MLQFQISTISLSLRKIYIPPPMMVHIILNWSLYLKSWETQCVLIGILCFASDLKKHFNALLYLHGTIYPLDISKGNISEVSVIELNNLIDFSLFSNHIKTKTFTYTSQWLLKILLSLFVASFQQMM